MKQLIVISTLLMFVLTACSAASTPTESTNTIQDAIAVADIVSATQTALALLPTLESTSGSQLSTDYENAAPVSMQLVIGITQLENTDLAITPTQATSFLTVLNFLKDLSSNTSATQEQFDALIEQAQSILTAEQIASIANMKITQDTVGDLMQQQGNAMGNPPQAQGNPPAQGDRPEGTPPAGGPDGQPPSSDAMATPPANGINMGFLPHQLLDTLIQLMESKIASS